MLLCCYFGFLQVKIAISAYPYLHLIPAVTGRGVGVYTLHGLSVITVLTQRNRQPFTFTITPTGNVVTNQPKRVQEETQVPRDIHNMLSGGSANY